MLLDHCVPPGAESRAGCWPCCCFPLWMAEGGLGSWYTINLFFPTSTWILLIINSKHSLFYNGSSHNSWELIKPCFYSWDILEYSFGQLTNLVTGSILLSSWVSEVFGSFHIIPLFPLIEVLFFSQALHNTYPVWQVAEDGIAQAG